MTETEWLACQNIHEMLRWLNARGQMSERRLRLFAVNSLLKVLHLFEGRACQEAVGIIERYADGQVTRKQLNRVATDLDKSYPDVLRTAGILQAEVFEGVCNAASAEIWLAAPRAIDNAADAATMEAVRHLPESVERQKSSREAAIRVIRESIRKEQCDSLRDVFGPSPFRKARIDQAWLSRNDGTVRKLAPAAYDERVMPEGSLDRGLLAILADALEEAGCTSQEILSHCRSHADHVRGCWVIDLLLNKA